MLQRIVVEILVLSAVLVACSPGKAEVVTPMVNTPEVLKAARESSTATPRAPLVPTEAVMEISSSSDPGETILGAGTPTVTATAKVINRRVEAIDDFKMTQFLLPFDGIRPIYDPEFVAAEHALYQDEELVMGVAWEGEAKAYPVTVLRFREMVNDELAGIPILVTWWPICYTGVVHDRRIDGETFVFGNAGGLFMNAMTWYDHQTETIWSQPWGRAIEGRLKGVELFALPFQLTTWASWKSEHPQTVAMSNDVQRLGGRQRFDPDFVVGLLLAENARAYYYQDVEAVGIVNDMLAAFPILLWASDKNYHAYLRQVGDQVLTFRFAGEKLIDEETGSTWDISRGLSIDGLLKGQSLAAVPSMSAYDWAWLDFYPDSSFWEP